MPWSIVQRVIDFPPEVVYKLAIDFPRLAHSSPSIDTIEVISDVKEGVGTRTHWTVGVTVETDGGGVVEWEEEITDSIENEFYAFKVMSGEFPSIGFLRFYPYEMGTKTFCVFGEHHDYKGVNIPKIKETMMDQLIFMDRELKGELKDRSHKRTG